MFDNWKLEVYRIGGLGGSQWEYKVSLTHKEFRTRIEGQGWSYNSDAAFEMAIKDLYTKFYHHKEWGIPGSIPRRTTKGVDWICAWDDNFQAWYIETGREKRYEQLNQEYRPVEKRY